MIRCEVCGHVLSKHNDVGWCQVVYHPKSADGFPMYHPCPCDSTNSYIDWPELVASRSRLLEQS